MAKTKEPAQLSYEQALSELKKIAEAIENESVSIDELAYKVKRASELVESCKEKFSFSNSPNIKIYLQNSPKILISELVFCSYFEY